MSEILNDLRHTAVHEAGHAVVGRKLGLDMGQASVEQDDDSAGHSIVGDPHATLDRWWMHGRPHREWRSVIRARVLMLMAGAEAERAVIGRLQEVDGESGDGEDLREIEHVMQHHPGDIAGDQRRIASLRRASRRLVHRHRADIEAVAVELQERGTIPGHELDEMVSGPADGPEDPAWAAIRDAGEQGEAISLSALIGLRKVEP